ncbi:MAG: response regulator transcription factor [Pirellulales bacterium]|nr:response regulator transcription factor [Pirellulales bacterium]
MVTRSILVVEDEESIQELIGSHLLKEGYQVTAAETGEQALEIAGAARLDLVLLDLMLPGVDGLSVCRKLKENPRTRAIPVIMLTAKDSESDIITGLNLGADEYITKPFSPSVLMARVRAIFRRLETDHHDRLEGAETVIRIQELTIHPGRHEVLLTGRPLDLTATEFDLLAFLAAKPGWTFTRQQIIAGVHGDNCPITPRAVDVQIVGLRKKLASAGNNIETVRGVGYRFKDFNEG